MEKHKVIILLPGENGMLIRCKLEDFRDPDKMFKAYLNLKAHLETQLPKGENYVYRVN
jgi:hypothetical protein